MKRKLRKKNQPAFETIAELRQAMLAIFPMGVIIQQESDGGEVVIITGLRTFKNGKLHHRGI